ncbi:phosphoglycerate kinase [Geobacter benzoatilyticus]|uniref:Phosphoglycerate kinase n=1 Tax=Geobacter benzoatilyticus TaxID=2815309 RepID=A0ABX7Q236_9BACT|nr:phosphoglycerate kinase [Geobacter benzoatilyticus]QSV45171.1 phosphoglycerate kinase [Geobacter benzoatilyticus]
MAIRYIDEIENLNGKKVFIRVDFNVPLDEHQNITEDTRIRAVLPTINFALDAGAKVILASHLGRPKGERKAKYSMAPAAKRLSRLLNKEVQLAPDCIGDDVKKMIDAMQPGDVILLENVRFYEGEEKNDADFAKALANCCEIYINDAFAVSHRAHASVEAITKHFNIVAAGFLMKNEVNYFEKAIQTPIRPLVAILGGAKVSGKLEVLGNLVNKVDKIIIGGGMAFTFLKALGYNVGKSLVEEDLLDTARTTYDKAREKGVKFYLPVDCVAADRFNPEAETKVTTIQEIPEEWMALDIGPATVTLFTEALQNAKTIIWNGPMGVFEMDAFSRGTFAMVSAVANSYALTIVGGGDTDSAVHRAGEYAKISYISTGGGAFLELLEGKHLPGIKVLEENGK